MKRVDKLTEAAIVRHRLVDEWPVGTIATQLKVHHGVVRRVLAQHGLPCGANLRRARMIDPYVDFIRDQLQKYPKLHASRLHQMVRQRGYTGCQSHFRRLIRDIRPPVVHEPFLRLRTLVGEEAQVDWGSFGRVVVGRATRTLYAFVMTLSWSRMIWLQFFFDMKMANFLRGHVDGFAFFGGVPRKCLYDNLKSAVIEREGAAIRFNERILELATHYGFEPRAAAPRRGNEKGRVERAIRFIRDNFFAAREFTGIDDLNRDALDWSLTESADRRWPQDDQRTVRDAFAEEREKLRELPADEFPAYERHSAKVGRTPWLRFDGNDYSVPYVHVRQRLDVLADHKMLRIVDGGTLAAEHRRSYDRRSTIEDPTHTAKLIQYKRRAANSSFNHRLMAAAPCAETFIERAAQRGHNLGSITSRLLKLLAVHGSADLDMALHEVNGEDVVNVDTVRMVLEQRARTRGKPIATPVHLPRPELAELTVRAPKMTDYDNLGGRDDEES